MSIDRAVLTFAGVMVLASLALAEFVNPAWLWLTAFCWGQFVAGSLHRLLPPRRSSSASSAQSPAKPSANPSRLLDQRSVVRADFVIPAWNSARSRPRSR